MSTTRPAWATETSEPNELGEGAMHATTITVGKGSILVDQLINPDGSLGPVFASPDNWVDWDAQDCRDMAAALLKAAEIIDNA
jgi:hypothetical protein